MNEPTIKDILKYADQGEELEVKFILFLSDRGYMRENLFDGKHQHKITQCYNEFVRGYNHGYR